MHFHSLSAPGSPQKAHENFKSGLTHASSLEQVLCSLKQVVLPAIPKKKKKKSP